MGTEREMEKEKQRKREQREIEMSKMEREGWDGHLLGKTYDLLLICLHFKHDTIPESKP